MYAVCSTRDYVNSTLQDASNKEVAGIAIVVLVLVVSPIIIILMRNAVATIQVSVRSRKGTDTKEAGFLLAENQRQYIGTDYRRSRRTPKMRVKAGNLLVARIVIFM